MKSQLTMQEKAELAWGKDLPDWVVELALLTDANGLEGTGKRIGYTASVVSQTIGNKYPGDLLKVEEKVRGALMGATVTCPVLGSIGKHTCLDWQAKPRAITNSTRSKVYRACRSGCEHSRIRGGAHA